MKSLRMPPKLLRPLLDGRHQAPPGTGIMISLVAAAVFWGVVSLVLL